MLVRTLVDSISGQSASATRAARIPERKPFRSNLVLAFASLAVLLLSIGCASSRSGEDSPEPGTVQVALGSDGATASSPELTLDALRAGQSVYTIEGTQGTYTVELTEDQIADLVSGSTVMTEATGDNGSEQVRISVAKASKRGFGW